MCEGCPIGRFAAQAGQANCELCDAGSFSNIGQHLPGLPDSTAWTDTTSAARSPSFYRIRLE